MSEDVSLKTAAAIPALNEEHTIAKVILHARKHVERVLVVDDGSQDDTQLIAEALGAAVIKHDKNLGKGAALRDSLAWARSSGIDILVTLDADGQHDPEQIPLLVGTVQAGNADVAIGSRSSKPNGMSRHRWMGAEGFNILSQVKVDGKYVDTQSGFRAYSRRAIEGLVISDDGMGVESEILMRARDAGMKIVEVPVIMNYKSSKTSSKNSIPHAFEVLFSIVRFVSVRHPLTFYGGFGVASLLVSMVFGLWTFDYYQQWGRVVTNLALVSIAAGVLGFLSIFTAVILFTVIAVVREQQRR
jgi:glycosyltransferase involved in cell wall biosynthesis